MNLFSKNIYNFLLNIIIEVSQHDALVSNLCLSGKESKTDQLANCEAAELMYDNRELFLFMKLNN